ncbi:NADPH-dependent cytochrome P450 oxidoreductase [Basidiobolus meristosporus CBS 931.73]|uniref:NADPH--cytochrome P450 reductase n=1 Tax=Basidiobolus meristosporus CBS 931.73 TaxID=1314790 RepID=A0A1Y1YAP4_9FUNG|nr:NADPH-dependent cytochrome P450 oxidoreductase [Basidiobolus meristosporus CBS 931.73]|eukprot:ORX94684.1 NADPH-dependent cytochrome P450 oxidoreductase [Basidiobolus meristosporus CBS 931.73]
MSDATPDSSFGTSDVVIILVTVALSVAYLFRKSLFSPKAEARKEPSLVPSQGAKIAPKKNRNFIEKMNETDKNAVIFFGSQTGTAEDLAARLAKEGEQRYGLRCLVLDPEDCDMELLDQLPSDKIAFFVAATYGEGEPTDNAAQFFELLSEEEPEFSNGADPEGDGKPLKNLKYVVFGLGNKTYEFFNAIGRLIDSKLTDLGAQRIGERGEGDDDASMEEYFLAWKDPMWKEVCEVMGLHQTTQGEQAVTFTYKLSEHDEKVPPSKVYCGELSERPDSEASSYDAKNPYLAPIKLTRELFNESDGSCIHAEVDIKGTGMSYETGDHLGIFPVNSDAEVIRLAKTLGLLKDNKLDKVITVENVDANATKRYPFPVPTTYRVMFRHYLDICALPSRQFFSDLATLANNEPSKAYLKKLGEDKDFYHEEVVVPCHNVGEMLERLEEAQASIPEGERMTVPIPLLIEGLGRLQPRYYSISSSGTVHPDTVHITAVVLRYQTPSHPDRIRYGVATNYLYSIHRHMEGTAIEESNKPFPSYYIHGVHDQEVVEAATNDANLLIKVPSFVRKSNFRLPTDSRKPVIMIGPGTGVAPFRGFVQERVYQAEQGKDVGPTMLFFGCRRRDEDFLYADEWDAMFQKLPNSEMITAFSREQEHKIYVQHRLKERQSQVWNLIHNEGGYVYVCGDAKRMAKDVHKVIVDMAVESGAFGEEEANEYVKKLRTGGRYQEDVWA